MRALVGGLSGRAARVLVVAAVIGYLGGVVLAAPASAHPLGNFTVSHYAGLTLHPDRLDVLRIVDRAEIPTVQETPGVDTDGDGSLSPGELATAAERECPLLVESMAVQSGTAAVDLRVIETSMTVAPGAAGLLTMRLTCRLTAEVDLSRPSTVTLRDDYLADRIGWREITASGEGVSLLDPPVPASSISDELRNYPKDLLRSPLQTSSVELSVAPGGTGGGAPTVIPAPGIGQLNRLVAAGDDRLQSLVAAPELTLWVGALAVALAALLGAGHAALPGHGKTVMAAYLAGRRGRRRDAFVVGATVTITHTVGVLVIGLLLSVAGALAGDQLLRVLGVVSGLLVTAVGAFLLRDALRERHENIVIDLADATPGALVSLTHAATVAMVPAGATITASRPDDHPVVGHAGTSHVHDHSHAHSHSHDHGHTHGPGFGRRGLIGLGVAGGLVPSPSALIVLLGAIALGRTVFGVLLVLAYGIGMAGTLTAVGLLLVRTRERLSRMGIAGRLPTLVRRVLPLLPLFTAALVVIVGAGLVLRGLFP